MELLAGALKAVEEAIERAEYVAEHARHNGKVDFGLD
jgi:hypothetical protein